jgi:hypothetical protein
VDGKFSLFLVTCCGCLISNLTGLHKWCYPFDAHWVACFVPSALLDCTKACGSRFIYCYFVGACR